MSAFFKKPEATPISNIIWNAEHPRAKTDLADLIESISTVGVIQPITISKDGRLIAGKRRMAAVVRLGLDFIPTFTVDLDNIGQEIASIDDNILHLPLNSLEYDEALYRRKFLYEQKHPDTRAGVAGAAQSGTPSFTEDAAKKLDISRKSVEMAVNRAKLATPKVKQAREGGLAPSKVNEIVTLDPMLQDEILPLLENKSYSEVRDMVKRVKDIGLEDTIKEMQSEAKMVSHGEVLDRELSRVQKELSTILTSQSPLGIAPRDKVVKRTRGVMRMMRAFLGRVKHESDLKGMPAQSTAYHPSSNEQAL